MAELPNAIYAQIESLSAEGDALVDAGKYREGLARYQQAIILLPPPKEDWEAWTWLFGAIGDAHFANGNWGACQEAFREALKGPDGLGNPFIHLRLGQSALQLGDERSAVDELLRAYMGGGKEIFEEDERYLDFLSSKVKL